MQRLAVALYVLPFFLAPAQDWPEFRGPNRSGVSDAKGLPTHFDPKTNVAWSVEVPPGRSSPIVSKKHLFLTAADAKNLMVLSFDSVSGKVLWRHSKARSRVNDIDGKRNDPASPTPATDGMAVYAFFQDFGLVAITLEGKVLWELPLGPFLNNYGMGS